MAGGLACLGMLALGWGSLLGLDHGIRQSFSQLGEPSSYHSVVYDLAYFGLAGALLVVFGINLGRVLGRSRLSVGVVALLTVLGSSTVLLGILPYGPGSSPMGLVRQTARAMVLWSPAVAAMLVGVALVLRRQRGQAAVSIVTGVLMAGLAWLIAGFNGNVLDTSPLVVATSWYVGMAVWLLQQPLVARWRGSRLAMAPFVVIRVLAVIGMVALVAYWTDSFLPALPAAIVQVDGRTQVATLNMGGLQRHFRVYRPNRIARSPGLVILLHGALGSGLEAEMGTAFDVQAHRLGWIVAYPDGYRDGWDAYGCCHHPGVDDVAFVAALIDEIQATDQVDPDRVYVTGLSRGGMMSYRLGCELASRISAIAPVAGNMGTRDGSARGVGCRPVQPVSVLAIQGTADQRVPIQGGYSPLSSPPVYAPFSDVIGVWRDVDGCTVSPSTNVSGPTTTTIWACRGGSTVETKVIAGGEHDWPGGPGQLTYGAHEALDASAVIADFFAAHPRTRAAVTTGGSG